MDVAPVRDHARRAHRCGAAVWTGRVGRAPLYVDRLSSLGSSPDGGRRAAPLDREGGDYTCPSWGILKPSAWQAGATFSAYPRKAGRSRPDAHAYGERPGPCQSCFLEVPMTFNPFPTHIPAACASALLLALSSAPAWSGVVMDVVQWPQASGPCSGTLQACVDSRTQYTRIEIATTTAVDENIHPGVHSLWLAPAPGVQAGFAPGRRISGELVNPAGQLLAVTGLDFTDGGIDVHCSGGGHAQLVFRDLDLVNPGSSGSGIRIGASSACVAESLVYGNRINGSPDGFNAGLIDISADGGTLLASIA